MKPDLQKLTLEHWYKMLITASFSILVLALLFPMHGVPNAAVQLLALGGLCIGTGEWINHPLQTRVSIPDNLKITSHPRRLLATGIVFDLLGFVLLALGARVIVLAL